jgi:hypothetical protein
MGCSSLDDPFSDNGVVHNIDGAGTKDINKPIPWIITTIFTPIAIGVSMDSLTLSLQRGEYDKSSSLDSLK